MTWKIIVLLLTLPLSIFGSTGDWDLVPALYQGRYRPVSVLIPTEQELLVLPAQNTWLPITHLQTNQDNFTLYDDALFQKIRNEYLQKDPNLAKSLSEAYLQIAGTPYLIAFGKELRFPTVNQLRAESFYYRYPLIPLCVGLYLLALILWLVTNSRFTMIVQLMAFALHTILLGLRIYILGRPPVANMFETILYVPWFAVFASLVISNAQDRRRMLIASNCVVITLLSLLQATRMDIGMENVQAVLDSQYWLIVHVLLVVGSYGIYALAGVLGHLYFFNTSKQPEIAQSILKALYLGTGMLIAGTLLGGVWAAQSWGRFWDWDPKESWAFISICIYIIGIHLYRFKRIGNKGLALGSIIGLQAIAFTWYGVNYILGTGLHSYGFGNGGEIYFYLFLILEACFLCWASLRRSVLGS